MAGDSAWIGPVITGTFALLGVLVGATATHGAAWWLRKKRRLGHWRALRAEADVNHDQAKAYLAANIDSPAYRLPRICYDKAFPALLEEGTLSVDDARAILIFYDQVDQMNRALDEVDKERRQGNDERAQKDAKRVRMKAGHLTEAGGSYPKLLAVIKHHLPS